MFDTTTATLIRSAPPLEGLDLERLPEDLTAAYAELVAFRVANRRRQELVPRDRLERLQRLASTYEALTIIGVAGENAAAAFVAATAHRLIALSTTVGLVPRSSTVALATDAVSSHVSAMLLFLIAGYPSDAAEMARHVRDHSAPGSAARLLEALAGIGDGRLRGLLDVPLGNPLYQATPTFPDVAAETLWHQLLFGVRGLIAQLLGQPTGTSEAADEPNAVFQAVQRAAVRTIDIPGLDGAPIVSALPGPHHLASLLIRAGNVVLQAGVINVKSPDGVDPADWLRTLQGFALRRPYLWHNHLQAIDGGLLDSDTSAVVSFPTGGGKSTIAELKAAATLLTNRKVVFLAPTHALVGQVTRQFRAAFPEHSVRNSIVAESYYTDLEPPELPDVTVMTPERCLTLLGLHPEAFGHVGLLIFDECHLLHSDNLASERGINAMLSLLGTIERAPDLNVLLMSAMISNGDQLAGWIQSILGRPCLNVAFDWKPTRQVRACVVYNNEDVSRLNATLGTARRNATTKGVPAEIRRHLRAVPFGLFGLKNMWSTRASEDYSLLVLSEDTVELATSQWHLTANKNETSARLAASLARENVRVLVFTQDVKSTGSIAHRIAAYAGSKTTQLTSVERQLFHAAAEECGGEEYVLGPIDGICAAHHSLLLPFERELNESLFSRDDGIVALVATPTLAQGMNLPAEAVVIAGDDRFDAAAERPAQVEAHELLNAAGRAGRAGHAAQGLVFVVPGEVVGFDPQTHTIGRRWFKLQEAIFSKADNCLAVEDPIEAVLDRIHETVDINRPSPIRYLVNRLPLDHHGQAGRRMLSKSFGAYLADRRGQATAFKSKIEAAVTFARRSRPETDEPGWRARVGTATGVPSTIVSAIDAGIERGELLTANTSVALVRQAFRWFARRFEVATYLLGEAAENALGSKAEITKATIETLADLTAMWMDGAPLLELQFRTKPKNPGGSCADARKFVMRSVPEISYTIGLGVQIFRERQEDIATLRMPLLVESLASCVRVGVNGPELLAAHMIIPQPASRQAIREQLIAAASRLQPATDNETFMATRRRVRDALRL